jgi:GNAT superfamily N-acetyltransferase
MNPITIRRATAADLRQIGALWAQLVAYHQALMHSAPVARADGPAHYAERIGRILHDPAFCVVVAAQGVQLVGYAVAHIDDVVPSAVFEVQRGCLISDVFVVAAHRGAGVGKALVDAIKTWCAAQGVAHIDLYVAADNAAGVAFWQAQGGQARMVQMRISTAADDQHADGDALHTP